MSLIKHIDNDILEFENLNNKKPLEKQIKSLAKKITAYLQISSDNIEDLEVLFDKSIAKEQKRFVSIILLRVLYVNHYIFDKLQELKFNSLKLFDENSQDIYKKIGLKDNSQPYQKIDELKNHFYEILSTINENFPEINSLDNIDKFENKFRSIINNKNNKPLINYFIKPLLENINLDEIFSSIRNYYNAEDVKKVNYYQTSIDLLEDSLNNYSDYLTSYADKYIIAPLNQLYKIIQEDFEKSKFSKKADLELKELNKKYPFNQKGIELLLGFLISNNSDGIAFNVVINVTSYSEEIVLFEDKIYIDYVSSDDIVRELKAEVQTPTDHIIVEFEFQWQNSNNEYSYDSTILQLEGQDKKIDWDKLIYQDPYSLEAVENESELVGRSEILQKLVKKSKQNTVSSHYIYGQRRVGKTSIAKTFMSKIRNDKIQTIYLEAGDWCDSTSAENSINNLSMKICNKIKLMDQKFSNLEIPPINGSFSNITNFFDKIETIDDSYKIIIILDEFDRISENLYSRGDIGQAFMLSIRSISNRKNFGFILIGGEKLEIIISQWQELNKFSNIRVDYFDKNTAWSDFKQLVSHPVNGILEFSEEAMIQLYNQTSGNPYFTKLICSELFNLMINKKDTHVTEREIKTATFKALHSVGAPQFSHFWEDGIKEARSKEEEVSVARRKLLLSIRDALHDNSNFIAYKDAMKNATEKGLNEESASFIFNEFKQRKVLKESESEGYNFVMQFFKDWLLYEGYNKIIPTLDETESFRQKEIMEAKAKVSSEELTNLIDSWPESYQGRPITTDNLRTFLEQFGEPSKQRLIFNILQNLKFYSLHEIRGKLGLIYKEINKLAGKKGYVQKLPSVTENSARKRKRNDILVSHLDHPFKSGSEYGKIFVDVNNIYYENAVEYSKIGETISNNQNIRLLVILDDISSTGLSFEENLKSLNENYGNLLKEKKIHIFIGLITGFLEAKNRIENLVDKLGLDVEVIIIDPLKQDDDKVFSENSNIFSNQYSLFEAKSLCEEIGKKLEKSQPLGFGNSQLAIVFPNNCPNNSLPILWKRTKNWYPLFERK